MLLSEAYGLIIAQLTAAGIEPEEARSQARLLLARAGACSPAALFRRMQEEIAPALFAPALARLLQGEPLQYVLGGTEFMGLNLRADARALIPRGDSEPVAEAAVGLMRGCAAPLIADICTGSGAYALALACFLPRAMLHAADISPAALALAAENARALNLEQRIRFHQGDLCAPLLAKGLKFDLIVCNPPYIARAELARLAPQLRYEPLLALDGGEDGLDYFRRLLKQAPPLLNPGAYLLLEHGYGQSPAIRHMAEAAGLDCCRVIEDYGHRERALLLQKPV